jgi:hypothetical protein
MLVLLLKELLLKELLLMLHEPVGLAVGLRLQELHLLRRELWRLLRLRRGVKMLLWLRFGCLRWLVVWRGLLLGEEWRKAGALRGSTLAHIHAR